MPNSGIRNPLQAIFLTVFIDLLGFGLFITDLQLRAKDLGLSGFQGGLMMASFSIAQALTGPYIGRLSDRVGRRPVLLISTPLSFVSYLIYAHVTSVPMMLVTRILSGVAAGNMGVAFAYAADVTTPETRAKGMGTVGAAFGLGFILGPPLGALLLKLGNTTPLYLGYVGAALVFVNFVYLLFLLPESHKPGPTTTRPGLLHNYAVAFRNPNLALLLVMVFAVGLGFTQLETTFFQLLNDPRAIFGFGDQAARDAGALILATVGVCSVIAQVILVPRLSPIVGESRLLRLGYALLPLTLYLIPHIPLWFPGILVTVLLAISSGVAQALMNSLISRNSPTEIRGGIFGVTQSLGSVARCVGPVIAWTLFKIKPSLPYTLGAAIAIVGTIGGFFIREPDDRVNCELEREVVSSRNA